MSYLIHIGGDRGDPKTTVSLNMPNPVVIAIDQLAKQTRRTRSEVTRALIFSRLEELGVAKIQEGLFRL